MRMFIHSCINLKVNYLLTIFLCVNFQVPQPSFQKLIKSEIKTESEDQQECMYMDAMFSTGGAQDKTNLPPDNFLSTYFSPDPSYNNEQTDFLTVRASPSSCFTSTTLLTPVLPSPPQFLATSKTNSYNYINESGTSGCVVTENSNGESSDDHSLEYIDLDKQKLYDVLDPYSNSGKFPFLMEEPNHLEVPLEEAVLKMHNDIRNDSDKLNIPFGKYPLNLYLVQVISCKENCVLSNDSFH